MLAISVGPLPAATLSISHSRKLQKPCIPHSRKIRKPCSFCTARLDLHRVFDPKKHVCWARCMNNRNTMRDSNRVCAGRSEEGVQAFEQEAFVGGSLNLEAGGLESTLNNISKWLIAAVFAGFVIWRHDAEILWAVSGAVLNVILSTSLKKILNHERPVPALKSDPGMPSSHAQSIFYAVTFLCLSLLEFYGIKGFTALLCVLFLVAGSYFSWLRVSQRLHTVAQVIVGAFLGSIVSILWFFLWKAFVFNLLVSYLWVRVVVILGAIGFCVGFLHHAYQHWIMEAGDSIG